MSQARLQACRCRLSPAGKRGCLPDVDARAIEPPDGLGPDMHLQLLDWSGTVHGASLDLLSAAADASAGWCPGALLRPSVQVKLPNRASAEACEQVAQLETVELHYHACTFGEKRGHPARLSCGSGLFSGIYHGRVRCPMSANADGWAPAYAAQKGTLCQGWSAAVDTAAIACVPPRGASVVELGAARVRGSLHWQGHDLRCAPLCPPYPLVRHPTVDGGHRPMGAATQRTFARVSTVANALWPQEPWLH